MGKRDCYVHNYCAPISGLTFSSLTILCICTSHQNLKFEEFILKQSNISGLFLLFKGKQNIHSGPCSTNSQSKRGDKFLLIC